jgi:hypothetical protein
VCQKSPASAGSSIFISNIKLDIPNAAVSIVIVLCFPATASGNNNANEYSRMPIFAIDIGKNNMHVYARVETMTASTNEQFTKILSIYAACTIRSAWCSNESRIVLEKLRECTLSTTLDTTFCSFGGTFSFHLTGNLKRRKNDRMNMVVITVENDKITGTVWCNQYSSIISTGIAANTTITLPESLSASAENTIVPLLEGHRSTPRNNSPTLPGVIKASRFPQSNLRNATEYGTGTVRSLAI